MGLTHMPSTSQVFPAGRTDQYNQHLYGCALARPIRAEIADNFMRPDRKTDFFNNGSAIEILGEAPHFQAWPPDSTEMGVNLVFVVCANEFITLEYIRLDMCQFLSEKYI
jgi:hypothetical protein